MYETSLRIDEIASANIIQYNLEGRADQATKLPEEEEEEKKKQHHLAVCLRAKWFVCNTISKIFMVIPQWMSTKYETLCFSHFFLHCLSFCNLCLELTRPQMCSPGPPSPWAALVQTTSEDRSGMESFAGLEEQIQGRKGENVNSEARISSCSWCGHTAQNISIDGRKGWFSCLSVQCLPYFI